MATNRELETLNRDQLSSLFRKLDQYAKEQRALKTQRSRADFFKIQPATYNRLLTGNEKETTNNLRDKISVLIKKLDARWEIGANREVIVSFGLIADSTSLDFWRELHGENLLEFIYY